MRWMAKSNFKLALNSLSSSLGYLSRTAAANRKWNPRTSKLFITSRNVSKNTCMYVGALAIWRWKKNQENFHSFSYVLKGSEEKRHSSVFTISFHDLSWVQSIQQSSTSIHPPTQQRNERKKSPLWSPISPWFRACRCWRENEFRGSDVLRDG